MIPLGYLTFANGEYEFPVDRSGFISTGFKVKAVKNLSCGDWKTTSIHGPRQLLKDEEMTVDEIFFNFYGIYVQGRNPRGQLLYLSPKDLHLVDKPEGAIGPRTYS